LSLLSDTQGTPERVWSLLRLLAASGGAASFADVNAWMNPDFRGGTADRDSLQGALRQTIGAASSLGLVEMTGRNQYRLKKDLPNSLDGFADLVHSRLVAADSNAADSVMFEAYGAVVALTEKHGGTGWAGRTRTDVAADIDHALRPVETRDGERRFNDTKYAPWVRWMTFLGLGYEAPMAGGRTAFYPYPAERLSREFSALGDDLPPKREHEADLVLPFLSRRMPYLDGGRWFQAAAERLAVSLPPQSLTRVLSGALRDLHDDGRLLLAMLGDTASAYTLGRDPAHSLRVFKTLLIHAPETADA
jgi:hypothetical protein